MNKSLGRKQWQPRVWLGCWLAVLPLLAGGCSPPATTISGVVTLDAQPLANASLDLFPVAGDGQSAGAVTDDQGQFRAVVSPTRLAVTVTAVEVIGQKKNTDPAFPDIEMVDVVRQVVPLRYTQRHTTPLAVEPEAEKNTTVNFELRSSDSR